MEFSLTNLIAAVLIGIAMDYITYRKKLKVKSNMKKSTNKELVEELEAINQDGKYNEIIENAKANRYHDYKNPLDVICGKVELSNDLSEFPELAEMRQAVVDGAYDELADEEDKAEMRKWLPENQWPSLGL